jgi:2-amino-4-hydroxy-6-hydroxymethyldihydropteridine diphosphokinase
MPEVFVGLGSNIEPETHLRWAVTELERRFGRLAVSDAYRSPAFGFEGPEFLNMVVGFKTGETVDAVEAELSALENARGRETGPRSGSRTLDLDLLLFGERVDAARRLPRADVLCYPFVLAPLAAMAPSLRHPVSGVDIGSAWARVSARHPELERIGLLAA